MRYLQTKYKQWLNENVIASNPEEVRKAMLAVKRAIMWINIVLPFYAEILVHLSVYGSYQEPTAWTDCETFIAYNPKFINGLMDEQVRYVMLHELLHVILQHNKRAGSRDHELWNQACDYSLNPIIHSDKRFGEDFNDDNNKILPPGVKLYENGKLKTYPNGKPQWESRILYDKDYDGLSAEDIYDILLEKQKNDKKDNKEEQKNKEAASMGKFGDKKLEPIEGSFVQERIENKYVDYDDLDIDEFPEDEDYSKPSEDSDAEKEDTQPIEGEGNSKEQGNENGKSPSQPGKPVTGDKGEPARGTPTSKNSDGSIQGTATGEIETEGDPGAQDKNKSKVDPQFHKDVKTGGIPKSEPAANRVKRDASGDVLSGDAKTWDKKGKSTILRGRRNTSTNWDAVGKEAFARASSQMSEKTRELLSSALNKKPAVDWNAELKKWYDYCLKGSEYVLPNRRLLSSGTVTYGTKRTGLSGLKTIVAVLDTSGSISEDQKMTFLNEVTYLAKYHNSDQLVIIYCSDAIDGYQIVKRGQKIDISLMKSTGGNREGFIPPFRWIQQHRIKPSVFIYLTDTGGAMPDKNEYGIASYANKVIWFICSEQVYNTPPFGKCIFMPVGAIQHSKHQRPGRL